MSLKTQSTLIAIVIFIVSTFCIVTCSRAIQEDKHYEAVATIKYKAQKINSKIDSIKNTKYVD